MKKPFASRRTDPFNGGHGQKVMPKKVVTDYDSVDFHISKRPDHIQSKYIQRMAEKSPLTHKHGCVIVDKKSGEIISKGFNSTLNNVIYANLYEFM